LVYSDSDVWGFWKDKFGDKCATAQSKIKRGVKIAFETCDVNNTYQQFTFDSDKDFRNLKFDIQ